MKTTFLLLAVMLTVTGAQAQAVRYRSGIFLHHSTGDCIWGPNGSPTSVPAEIAAYNALHGLHDADSVTLDETSWPLTPWDNEWARWHRIFAGQDADANIAPMLAANRIVVIKSCFPSSSMSAEGGPSDTLDPTAKTVFNYQWHWRNFIRVMAGHPENFFVVWTNAPLVAGATTDQEAGLSSAFCRWAADTLAKGLDPLFGPFTPNVAVFDFFHILAGPDGKLPAEHAAGGTDSHPNAAATALAAPLFVKAVFDAAIAYEKELITVPPAPVLIVPPDGAENQQASPLLRWHHPSGALRHHVQLSTDSAFSLPAAVDTTLTDSSFVPAPLTPAAAWYWRVCAENNAGEGEWSPVWRFSTAPVTGAWYHMDRQWNLVSLPGTVTDPCRTVLFPASTSNAFFYTSGTGYHISDTLRQGTGYWLKFGFDQMVNVVSDTLLTDTIQLVPGWNCIGTVSVPLAVTAIRSDQPGVVLSQFFGYRGRYIVADTLVPGKGYWVKSDRDCSVIFPAPGIPAGIYRVRIAAGIRARDFVQ